MAEYGFSLIRFFPYLGRIVDPVLITEKQPSDIFYAMKCLIHLSSFVQNQNWDVGSRLNHVPFYLIRSSKKIDVEMIAILWFESWNYFTESELCMNIEWHIEYCMSNGKCP